MKAYLLLTGLIGLVDLGGGGQNPSKMMILLLRTDFGGSPPEVVRLVTEEIAIHSPRVEFWPIEAKLPSERESLKFTQNEVFGFSSKYSWQIEDEDIEIRVPGKPLVFEEGERKKFADTSRVLMAGKVVGERVKRECVDLPVGGGCRAGIVGRIILNGGTISAVELGQEPDSLNRSSFDQSLWQFRSTKNPSEVSSNYFTFASAVLVELGDAEDVRVMIEKWPDSNGKGKDGGGKLEFKIGPSSPKSDECQKLLGEDEPCSIIHILNVDDTPEHHGDLGSLDSHFALFTPLVDADDLLLPFRKMFFVATAEGASSKPSGRCVPKLLYLE